MNPIFQPALNILEPAARQTLSAAHSQRFQPLVQQLLTIFSAEGIIPAMTEEEIRQVVYLSRFHDIGKQCIPGSVLQKCGKLTLQEKAILQSHPVQGVRLLRSIPSLRQHPAFGMVCDICLHHHERWDGGGYPDGLAAEHITPYVHVVSLADAYDALRTERPYKRALSHEDAMAMLMDGQCGAFSPDMLECFHALAGEICTPLYWEAARVG